MSTPDGPFSTLAEQVQRKRQASRREEELYAIAQLAKRLAARAEAIGEPAIVELLMQAAEDAENKANESQKRSSHEKSNLVAACRSCNSNKKDRTVERWKREQARAEVRDHATH